MLFREIAVINRRDLPAFDFFDIAAVTNPFLPQCRQALLNITLKIWIAPRAAGVLNTHRLIALKAAAKIFGRRERDLAERNAKIGM